MKKYHTNIALVAPAASVKGGITTVINSILENITASEYKFYRINTHLDGKKLLKLSVAIVGIIKMLFILLSKNIDIVYLHTGDVPSPERKYIFYRIAKIFKKKVLLHWHGASFMEQYYKLNNLRKNIIKNMLSNCEMVICLSKTWENEILNIAPDAKTIVIHNAVKIPKVKRLHNKKKIIISFLGHVGTRKGIWDLVHVFKRVAKNDKSVAMYIGGDGDVKRLKKELDLLGISGRVKYLGWINEAQRDLLFMKTDIYVLPSYGEGMPMSILEAMSYGIPVIATKVGGIPEVIINNETGFLIEPGDRDSLLKLLKNLIVNKELRLKIGKNARNEIIKNYNIKEFGYKLESIFDSI